MLSISYLKETQDRNKYFVVFFGSASKAGLKAPPNLYVMMATLLARSNRYSEIKLFVSNKVSLLFSVFDDDYIVYYRAMFHPYRIWYRYEICLCQCGKYI